MVIIPGVPSKQYSAILYYFSVLLRKIRPNLFCEFVQFLSHHSARYYSKLCIFHSYQQECRILQNLTSPSCVLLSICLIACLHSPYDVAKVFFVPCPRCCVHDKIPLPCKSNQFKIKSCSSPFAPSPSPPPPLSSQPQGRNQPR